MLLSIASEAANIVIKVFRYDVITKSELIEQVVSIISLINQIIH
jgi:hypothetical protein